MAAENLRADRMEGAEPRHALGSAFADQLRDAVLHLARRLVGEGDGEDLAREGAAARQDVGDPRRQHPRLAGAGAGQHQQRALERLDRLPLLGIELFQPRRRARGKRPRGDAAGTRGTGHDIAGGLGHASVNSIIRRSIGPGSGYGERAGRGQIAWAPLWRHARTREARYKDLADGGCGRSLGRRSPLCGARG